MYYLGLLTGMLISVFFLWLYITLKRAIYRKFAPRWYPVAKFSLQKDDSGVYEMQFYLTPEVIISGYTKKLPPIGISSSDIEVSIRSFHTKRVKYRVFWRYKN